MRDDLDEDDCGCDDEPVSFVKFKRSNLWLFVGAFCELIADIFMAFHKLFGVSTDACLQRYTYVNEQLKFQQEASASIEAITSGGLDAASGTARPS